MYNAIVDDDIDIPVIWGNILVIKHEADTVVDMDIYDWRLVKPVLEW